MLPVSDHAIKPVRCVAGEVIYAEFAENAEIALLRLCVRAASLLIAEKDPETSSGQG